MDGMLVDLAVGSEHAFERARKPNRQRQKERSGAGEERAARARGRALERARKAAERHAAERRRARVAAVLRRPAAKACECGLTPLVTDDELLALGGGCTAPVFICPTLDAVRRAAS